MSEPNLEQPAKEKVYIHTFGCQMNAYDTHKLFKILENGYEPAATAEEADLVLINTCSVRDKPEQKLYSMLGQMRELKTRNKKLLVGVGGCVAQQEGQAIVKRSKDVDFVFGTHNLSLVPSLVSQRKLGSEPLVAVNYRDEWEELPLGFAEKDSNLSRVSAFISISRGCNKNCAYCIVPTTRGPEVSRALDEILREARIAVARGAKEIILLGQTVNSYGLDLSPRVSFAKLLGSLSEIDGIARLRFVSPHPQEIRQDFFELIAANPKICRHIHMPLQSGSDSVLRAMNRNYKRKRYLGIIHELKSRVPDISFTTDIIVGFPGESEKDFRATLEVMDIVRFDNSYSYMFSARPGTAAAQMPDQIDAAQKLERLQVLQEKQSRITAENLEAWVGQDAEVLVDGPSSLNPQLMQGRISQNITFNFTGAESRIAPGTLIKARIEAAARYSLKGQALDFTEQRE